MKSNVSDHLEMVEAIYIDACAKCTADVSDLRDLETIRSRVKDQGVSFLTITLPNFCKDFERSLALGFIDSTCFRFFRKHGQIPAFLQGFTSRIFNRETGRLYDKQSSNFTSDVTVLVDSVRQICLSFKKMELDCTPVRVAAALANFALIEQTFEEFSPPIEDIKEFSLVASVLWDNMLGGLRLDMLVPRHGPGATAERISGNQKYIWRRWHDRLEPYFPLLDCAYSNSAVGSEEFKIVTIISQEQEQPVRVITVPKTLKAPRIIAIEPCCMQYAQQALRDWLYAKIERSDIAGGHVNFTLQSVNQKLALDASRTGQFATIDLSDASDRVPRSLALEMFRAHPDLRDSIDACRSTRAEMPDGTVIGPLGKFASMGSALCFPVEAMYFYTICVMALLKEQDLPVSHANCFKVSRDVYVYGDDLIVPQTNAETVLEYLQKYNCKVNYAKSFWSGSFRESCGVDAYDGELVTPIYLRKERPQNRRQASEIISWVQTANSFYLKGYWRTATLMYKTCERIIGPLPYVSENSSGLGRVSLLGYRSVERWNRDLQRFEVKAWSPSAVYRSDSIDGYAALKKGLLKLAGQHPEKGVTAQFFSIRDGLSEQPSFSDPFHLERTARHGAVVLRRRWCPSH